MQLRGAAMAVARMPEHPVSKRAYPPLLDLETGQVGRRLRLDELRTAVRERTDQIMGAWQESRPGATRGETGRAREGIKRMAVFALQRCGGGVSKDGRTPEIFHPLFVAHNIAATGGSSALVQGGIGHDLIEDNEVTHRELYRRFGPQVAFYIATATQPKKHPESGSWIFADDPDFYRITDAYAPSQYAEREEATLARIQTRRGIAVLEIELWDKLHNALRVDALRPARKRRYLDKIERCYLDIAARVHYPMAELFVDILQRHGYTDLPVYEAREGYDPVVVLPPREDLNPEMIQQLPVRAPGTTFISVYVSLAALHHADRLEIGLPRNGPYADAVERYFRPLQVLAGRSFLSCELDGSELIFRVRGIRKSTIGASESALKRFLDALREFHRKCILPGKAEDGDGT